MHTEKSLKEIKKMTSIDRYERAKKKTNRLVDALTGHYRTHANSAFVVYSGLISNQIPSSFAANAFNTFQRDIFHYEIIRLCTFWDDVDLEKSSIPTVVALADHPDVRRAVCDDHYAHYQNFDASLAEKWGKKARRRLGDGIRDAKNVAESELQKQIKNVRHKIAHQLQQTKMEQSTVVPNPIYGDEKKLLKSTCTAIKRLHLSLNGTDFDWVGTQKIAKRNSEAFWKGVSVNVLR